MMKKVTDYVAKWKMLDEKDIVIAGVSGGADSVCLLFVLLELQKKIGFEIIVVHVNHGLRGEAADEDERYVRELCEEKKLRCEIYRRDVALIAENRKQSLEEAGRDVRREAFRETFARYGATKIALAHHRNDNAETLLMNLARGSGLRGLCGMHPVRGEMIRPLLCLERREIEGYLDQNEIPYCTDETNASDDYTRNRIRNHIVPSLENDVNEKAVAHISETMEMLQGIQEYLEGETDKYYSETVKEDDEGLLIYREKFEEIPEVLRGNIIRKCLASFAKAEKDIHLQHINSVKELMKKQTGRKINLPYKMTAQRCYEGVKIERTPEDREKQDVEQVIDFSKEGQIRLGDMTLSHRIVTPDKIINVKSENPYTKCFDYDIMMNTVKVRARAPGDYITIDNSGKTQKLKSYFINEKIPQKERDNVLLLAEGSHVLWIIGYRRGCAYNVKPDTKKILEITIDKGEN